jgi:16S rRNA processing protein RimM
MPQSRILLGVIGRAHGVRGLLRVVSHTADPARLTAYGPLSDDRGRRFTLRWRGDGVADVAELVDGAERRVADRTAAEKLTNTRLYIDRAQLPEPEAEEFYLADLIGMAVRDGGGRALGTVAVVHDYGAGPSLEIATGGAPLLVPFTRACVPAVDVAAGCLTVVPPGAVDWPDANTPDASAPDPDAHRADTRPVPPGDAEAHADPAADARTNTSAGAAGDAPDDTSADVPDEARAAAPRPASRPAPPAGAPCR